MLVASGCADEEADAPGQPAPAASASSSSSMRPCTDEAGGAGVASSDLDVVVAADALEGWRLTENGYVFTEQNKYIGRITCWKNNISCKCQLHGSKCAVAKALSRYSERDMMLWLKAGLDIDIDAGGGAKTAAERHRAKAR